MGNSPLCRPNTNDRQDPLLLTQTALEQIVVNQQFREVADFFSSISYQHLIPQVVRDPRGFSPVQVQDDPYGRYFLLRSGEHHRSIVIRVAGRSPRLYRAPCPSLLICKLPWMIRGHRT